MNPRGYSLLRRIALVLLVPGIICRAADPADPDAAIDQLLASLRAKCDVQPLIDAVAALGDQATPILIDRFPDSEFRARQLLVRALCAVGTTRALIFVEKVIVDVSESNVASSAIRWYPVAREDRIPDLLIGLLHDDSLHYAAGERLFDMVGRDPSIAGRLVDALQDDARPEFDLRIGELLARVSGYAHTWCVWISPGENIQLYRNRFWREWWTRNREKDQFGWLEEAVSSDNATRRAEALQQMSRLVDHRAVPYFAAGLESPSDRVRYWSVIGLKSLQGTVPPAGYRWETFLQEEDRIIPVLQQDLKAFGTGQGNSSEK